MISSLREDRDSILQHRRQSSLPTIAGNGFDRKQEEHSVEAMATNRSQMEHSAHLDVEKLACSIPAPPLNGEKSRKSGLTRPAWERILTSDWRARRLLTRKVVTEGWSHFPAYFLSSLEFSLAQHMCQI
jgi:hypothetical protein